MSTVIQSSPGLGAPLGSEVATGTSQPTDLKVVGRLFEFFEPQDNGAPSLAVSGWEGDPPPRALGDLLLIAQRRLYRVCSVSEGTEARLQNLSESGGEIELEDVIPPMELVYSETCAVLDMLRKAILALQLCQRGAA